MSGDAASAVSHTVPDVAALTRELVSIPSISGTGGQTQILTMVQEHLQSAGLTVHVDQDSPPRFLLAHSPPPRQPLLLFACHADTVPAGDESAWSRHPYAGEMRDGKLHGRGASDMKAGLAAAVAAIMRCQPHKTACGLLLTVDEEVGCLGAMAAKEALQEVPVAAVIVPEPTNNRLVLGHKGALWLRLSAHGVAAHGSTPHLGRSALLALARTVLDIDARLPRNAAHPVLGDTSVNIGVMHAGLAPNMVADTAYADIDVRYVDDRQPAEILGWLGSHHPDIEVAVRTSLLPVLPQPQDPWVNSLKAFAQTSAAASYFTDGSVLAPLFPDAPVVIWGPGDPRQMHVRDEWVDIGNIHAAVDLYGRALALWAAVPRVLPVSSVVAATGAELPS